MRAFVLSGGGNLGPLQVGALRALLEQNIRPDMMVGCSVGALNAAFLVQDMSIAGIDQLANVWRKTSLKDIYPGNRLSSLWRIICGRESLHSNQKFHSYLKHHHNTSESVHFDAFTDVPLYITATNFHTGQLHVFGDDPNDRVLDALMASTALAPMHPPWTVNGDRFIDGGTVTPLPLRVAIERGATEIYALHMMHSWDAETEDDSAAGMHGGVTAVLRRSIRTMINQQVEHDLMLAEAMEQVTLHHLGLLPRRKLSTTDFSDSDGLIEAGYQQTLQHLDAPTRVAFPRPPGLFAVWQQTAGGFSWLTQAPKPA